MLTNVYLWMNPQTKVSEAEVCGKNSSSVDRNLPANARILEATKLVSCFCFQMFSVHSLLPNVVQKMHIFLCLLFSIWVMDQMWSVSPKEQLDFLQPLPPTRHGSCCRSAPPVAPYTPSQWGPRVRTVSRPTALGEPPHSLHPSSISWLDWNKGDHCRETTPRAAASLFFIWEWINSTMVR